MIITFSNRFVGDKAIRLWGELMDFERIALVKHYLRQAGAFDGFNAFSMRGLPRPEGDRHRDRLNDSDPVFAVWTDRQ